MKILLLSIMMLVMAPAAFCQLTVEVTAIRANVRKGPSTNARIVKSVPQFMELPVYAIEPRNGWYLVRLGKNWGGWIKATLVREKKTIVLEKSDV